VLHRALDDARREDLMTGDTEPHIDPRTQPPPEKHHDDTVSGLLPGGCGMHNLSAQTMPIAGTMS
jgi:hypothetical protein